MITEFLEEGSLFDHLHRFNTNFSEAKLIDMIEDMALGNPFLHYAPLDWLTDCLAEYDRHGVLAREKSDALRFEEFECANRRELECETVWFRACTYQIDSA